MPRGGGFPYRDADAAKTVLASRPSRNTETIARVSSAPRRLSAGMKRGTRSALLCPYAAAACACSIARHTRKGV